MNFQSLRWKIYTALLAASIAASIWVSLRTPRSDVGGEGAAPVIRPKMNRVPDYATAPRLEIPIRRFAEVPVYEEIHNPFGTGTIKQYTPTVPAIPPRRALVEQAHPTAPPLPYSYRGFLTDSDGAWLVQLGRGNEYLLAGPGDVIDSVYRLEALTDDEVRFTYLPLDTIQTLTMPASQP